MVEKLPTTASPTNGPAMAEDAPQWLRDAYTAQAQQLAELAAQQANTMASLASRIDNLQTRHQVPAVVVPETTHLRPPAFTPADTTEPSAYTKPRLPNPEKFDESDLALYPQFEGLLQAKLEIDATAIGNEKEMVWYSFERLSGD